MQPTDFQTFILLDPGKDIPSSYQKIFYHILLDIKDNLRHKARLVVSANCHFMNT
jgi:hypothetical protein